jgi:hypothetical protein
MDDREKALRQDGLLISLALAGLINGSHWSPWFDLLAGPIAAVLSGFLFSSPLLLFYFASLFVSLFTIVISGVPAAIYESSQNLSESNNTSLTIWVVSAVFLSLPAAAKMIGLW